MLAINSKFSATVLMTGLLIFMIGSAFAQQTPSQRYQPIQSVANTSLRQAPPSVHLPPQEMRRIRPQQGVTYNLSDSPQLRATNGRHGRTAQPQFEEPVMRGNIQKASYQTDGEPAVPSILLGSQPAPRTSPAMDLPPLPQGQGFRVPENLQKSPSDFSASMSQVRGSGPRIAPQELATQTKSISQQMAELRRRAQEKAKAEADRVANELAAQEAQQQLEADRIEAERQEEMRIEAEALAAAEAGRMAAAQAEQERLAEIEAEAERLAAEKVAQQMQTVQQEAADLAEQLAAQKLAAEQLAAEKLAAEQLAADRIAAERLAAQRAEIERLAMENARAQAEAEAANNVSASEFINRLTATPSTSDSPIYDKNVRQVSTQADEKQNAAIRLNAPSIEVETFGPATIGVNKAANYRVVVKNNSSIRAERILVGINLPQWVDIENVNLTTGGKEITDGENQARLVWSIDKIPGNASQTITVTAVPRKAEMFDVGVEWTLVPRVGKANVAVTEPKLEMSISGPAEVLYGETALYHVTVRNPGSGAAENVVVMLPEALGGERATLGDIEAGKEKVFQVELLARTAGELNLVATAAADQNLKTSAERGLTVRRANLNISLEGPGLKYAGSGAQYKVVVSNSGDATAKDVVTAVALPPGVKYLNGVDSVKIIDGGMRWPVGALEPGQTRTYKINCQLNTSGDLQLEVGARGKGDLAASSACLTTVETVADLVLTVADPKGPLPTGEKIPYQIKVQNRGTKTAKGVNLVMQFSEGIEPVDATGLEHRIAEGQVLFSPITQIDPGQEMTFKITAEALKSGTHIFRAQLTCQDSDAREIAEGTTRFFGEQVQPSVTKTATAPTLDGNDFGGNFQP